MCTINLAIRKDELPDHKLNHYMELVSWASWLSNDDGEGYIAKDAKGLKTDRNVKKINYLDLKDFFMVVSHQRFTTSGYGASNIHPHESKNFMLQHNGIFTGLGDKEKSDTKYYLEKLEKEFHKSGDVIAAIKTLNLVSNGSYSIVLYDKNSKKFYYYKTGSTSMWKLENKTYFFMSTKESALDYAKEMFDIRGKAKEVKAHRIYEITSNGLVFVSKFESMPSIVYMKSSDKYSGNQIKLSGKEWYDTIKYDDVLDESYTCPKCGEDTLIISNESVNCTICGYNAKPYIPAEQRTWDSFFYGNKKEDKQREQDLNSCGGKRK